jgi:hypothetical protein
MKALGNVLWHLLSVPKDGGHHGSENFMLFHFLQKERNGAAINMGVQVPLE